MPLHILHLEDDPCDREMVARALSDEGLEPEITEVMTGEQFLAALRARRFDAILSDFLLPGYGGKEALEAARQLAPETPFIFVTGQLREDAAVENLRRGATDYVLKAFLPRLGPAVRRAVHEAAERRRVKEDLALAARTAGFGLFEYDIVNGDIDWSPELKAIFGLSTGQAVTSEFLKEHIPADDLKRLAEDFERACDPAGPGIFQSEHRFALRGGEVRWVLLKGRIVFKGEGNARRAVRSSGVAIDITARRSAEEKARADEARFRATFNNAAVGIAHVSLDGRWLEVNERFCGIVGYPREELIRKTFADITHPDDLQEDLKHTEALLQGRIQSYSMEKRYFHKSGAVVWVHLTGTLMRDAGGAPDFFVAIIEDVTRRKEVETALRRSEERFRSFVETSSQVVWNMNTVGEADTALPAWQAFTGQSEDEARGFGWMNAIAPEDRERVADAWRRAFLNRSLYEVEYRLKRCDGRWRNVLARGVPVLEANGDIREWIGTCTDITEQKEAESARRESAERFRTLADNIPQLAWMADESGSIFWFNQRWLEYTGTTMEEMQGWGWQKVHHPDYIVSVTRKWQEHIAAGKAWEDTFPLRRADGEYRWFLSRGIPIRDEEGRVLRWFGTNTDITEQREDSRRKDEFLAMLGHELRNPLAAIRNATLMLKETPAEPAATAWAHGIIERQSANLARIVDDLLDVARITRGRIELRKEPLNVASVVSRAVESVRPMIENKRHRIEVVIAPGGALRVQADPTRFEQVIVNLLTNAAKYTPPGGSITVCVRSEGRDALVSVRDTGVGIAPDLLPRIFELFTQADRSLDRLEGGLGIGLSICRQLVELHGGGISVQSEGLGKGAEFTVRLPALAERSTDAPASFAGAAGAPANGTTAAERKTVGKRILVVDDNEDSARTLSRLLARRGHEVCLAYDGPSGLRAAEEFRPEVCLLDLGLPGLDGYELARRLRNNGLPHALLVAISGYAQESDRQRSREAGFNAHFAKPVDFGALSEMIARYRGSR